MWVLTYLFLLLLDTLPFGLGFQVRDESLRLLLVEDQDLELQIEN